MLKFKTTLLAAAIAGISSAAFAGTVTAPALATYSSQGLESLAATATLTTGNVSYTLGANYIQGDKITISVTPGALATGVTGHTFPPTLTGNAAAPSTDTITFGLINATDDTAKYRVDAISAGFLPSGVAVDFGALTLNASAVSAGSVAVSFESIEFGGSATDVIDSGIFNSKAITATADQLGDITVVTAADQIVDVAAERKAFVSGTNDTIAFTIFNDTTLTNPAVFASSTVDMVVDGGATMAFVSAAGGAPSFDVPTSTMTMTYAGGVTTDTITITPAAGAAAVVLAAQSFSLNSEFVAGVGATATSFDTGSADAGEWTLNGAMVNIPYMPYSANASQIMYVTNTGAQSGDIFAVAFDDAGNPYDLGNIGTASAGSVTKITGEVKDELEALGFTGGKVSITVTVNAPDADITVYASYNVSGNRAFVNTDQYKGQ